MKSDNVGDFPDAGSLHCGGIQRVQLHIHLLSSIAEGQSPAALQTVLKVVDFPVWRKEGCCCRRATGDRTAVREKYTSPQRVGKTENVAKRCVYERGVRAKLVHKHTLGKQNTLGRMDHLVT